ncbi:hypothetical protein C8R46DRAFT_1196727, partial [Mycena filopes]
MDPLIDLSTTLLQAVKDAKAQEEQQEQEKLALQAEVVALKARCAGLEKDLRSERVLTRMVEDCFVRTKKILETEKAKSAARAAALRVAEEELREARGAAAEGLAEAAKAIQDIWPQPAPAQRKHRLFRDAPVWFVREDPLVWFAAANTPPPTKKPASSFGMRLSRSRGEQPCVFKSAMLPYIRMPIHDS